MTIIEQWLQVSPDGGSGALEALCAFVGVLSLSTIGFGLPLRQSRKRLIS